MFETVEHRRARRIGGHVTNDFFSFSQSIRLTRRRFSLSPPPRHRTHFDGFECEESRLFFLSLQHRETNRSKDLRLGRVSLCSSADLNPIETLSNSSADHRWRSNISRRKFPIRCPTSLRNFSDRGRRPKLVLVERSRENSFVTFRPKTTATPPFSWSFSVFGST